MPFLPAPMLCHRATIKFNPPAFPEMMEVTASGGCNRQGKEFDWVN
jgi:hypothetical protein